MPVEPIPCAPGGGGEPVEVTTCCAPSIASAPLCLADGTTILAVVRSGCVECGADATDPEVVGWLDTAGAFTAGALPADAGPCDAGCLDTICRQRCDDLDGDGQADATYSELYCVRADGTAELVLTYQDDPTVPYTPVSPVECTYGCAESETVTLCDDSGPFLRRYSWLAGVGSFEDVALDGQTPHVVTGTVGACGGDTGCEEQTTPAATLGLCLADGTPIAVVVTRDCSGTVTQDGWLNLTTGTYSAGDPPLGTMACGNPRSISTTGTFCDVDPDTGDVLSLVLIEYTYGPDGDVTAVRLVDATTGQTYTPQGEVTTCPAGVEQPERDLVQLCDTADDGTVTEFVRDYARDETGQITGHSDYLLDGSAYTPAGTVGRCAEQCRDSSSTLLCDTAAQEAITVLDPANRPGADGWEIVSFTGYGPGYGPEAAIPYPVLHPAGNPTLMGARSDLSLGPNVGGPWSGYEAAPVRWVMRKTFTAPEDGIAVVSSAGFRGDGGARVRVNNTDAGMYGQWNQPATTGTAQIPVTAGPNIIEIEVRDVGGPNWITGRLDVVMTRTVQFMRRTVVDCETGETVSVVDTTLDGEPYEVTGEVGQCEPVAECCEPPPPEARVDVETALLCVLDEASGEITAQVIAERVYDDQSGTLAEQRLTSLDGDPYTLPANAVLTACQSTPEGRDVELTPLCVVDNATGNVIQRILAEAIYDTATGDRLSVRYVDPLTWGPVAVPGGTHFDLCPEGQPDPAPDVEVVQLCDLADGEEPVPFLRHLAYLPGATAPTVADTALDGVTPYVLTGTAGVCSEPCAVRAVIEACRCDDTDGDGLPDTGYLELLGVDCAGQLTSLGTYTDGLAEPYTPVSPVDCATADDEEGADPAHGVQARRVDLAAGASWDAAAVPSLQSVTAVAHGGTGTITTADGPSTLRPGESVTWSVVRDVDAALTGPLTITTVTGTVTVSWTQGVTL